MQFFKILVFLLKKIYKINNNYKLKVGLKIELLDLARIWNILSRLSLISEPH
jgi:hypothetical protein